MAHEWPLFDLRIRTPRLELRLPDDDDIVELLGVARAGIHDKATMPFAVPWTDVPSPEFERSFMQFHWRARASWITTDWHLPLAVIFDDRAIGTQEVSAKDFATRRTVETGSWLGRRYQGLGIGTEMRAAVLHLAFDGLGASVAWTGALEANEASTHVSRKLGYRANGERVLAPRGVPVVEHRFELRREDWRYDVSMISVEHLAPCLSMFGLA